MNLHAKHPQASGPRSRARRWAPLAPLLLLALLAPLAAAQDAVAAPTQRVYDLYQFGNRLGETGLVIERGEEATTASSYVDLPGTFAAENRLVAGPDGAAREYELKGEVQGVEFSIDVTFTDAGADMTLTQFGATQSLSLPSTEPLYVFDNNFIDGYQLAAYRVLETGEGETFAALVPQGGAVGSMTYSEPATATVEYGGSTVTATHLAVAFVIGPQAFEIDIYLDEEGDILVLEQEPGGVSFVRRETGADAAPGAPAPKRANPAQQAMQDAEACLQEREVSIGSTGETLHGKLTLPLSAAEGGRGAPTLLLIPGSGGADMDGNAPPLLANSIYKQLAFELACHGYGVLRTAKLGIAPSTGDANAVTIGTYVSNAADWLAFLAEQPGVDAGRLGVIGHSEGGLIALAAIAEGRIDPDALVLIATAGRPLGEVLREQLIASFERAGYAGAGLDELVQQIDEALDAIRAAEGTRLELTGELSDNLIANSLAQAAGLLRSELDLDPLELAARVDAPTVVLQGLKDVQVLQVDGRNLAGALPGATLLEFRDLTHSMADEAGDPLEGALPAADTAISPTMVQALATWLNGHFRPGR